MCLGLCSIMVCYTIFVFVEYVRVTAMLQTASAMKFQDPDNVKRESNSTIHALPHYLVEQEQASMRCCDVHTFKTRNEHAWLSRFLQAHWDIFTSAGAGLDSSASPVAAQLVRSSTKTCSAVFPCLLMIRFLHISRLPPSTFLTTS